jgi:hypothetical protein
LSIEQQPVRVFTIAYGFGSNDDEKSCGALKAITDTTRAATHDATDPNDIIERLVGAIISTSDTTDVPYYIPLSPLELRLSKNIN